LPGKAASFVRIVCGRDPRLIPIRHFLQGKHAQTYYRDADGKNDALESSKGIMDAGAIQAGVFRSTIWQKDDPTVLIPAGLLCCSFG